MLVQCSKEKPFIGTRVSNLKSPSLFSNQADTRPDQTDADQSASSNYNSAHMSNQQSSIFSPRKFSTKPTFVPSNEKIKKKNLHKQQSPRRSPLLQDYLNIPISSISRTTSNGCNLSSSSSSSISIEEPPRGCFNFLSKTPLRGPRPKLKFLSKNPKSSPNPKEDSLAHKLKRTCSTKSAPKVKTFPDFYNVEEKCYSGELFNFPGFVNASISDDLVVEDCTPVGKLVSSGSVLKTVIGNDDCKFNGEKSNTSGTPPVQSSLSPEIQCGSSVLVSEATPSTCYGAGHVVSGITDSRKSRPRGTLIVGSSCSSGFPDLDKDIFDEINDEKCKGVVRKSRPSFVPLPAEASMSWNLSPSQEEEGESMKGERVISGLLESRSLVCSDTRHVPSMGCRFDSNMFRYTDYSDTSNTDIESGKKTRITLLSPTSRPEFQGFFGHLSEKVASPPAGSPCAAPILKQEERTSSRYNINAEISPISQNSVGSENVIQTPKSDSSKERHTGRFWFDKEGDQKDTLEYELDSVSELLEQASLSPWSQTSPLDPLGPRNNLADLNSPSKSAMRISWRDGLVSRIFETDDLDFCRMLSDEENEVDGYGNDILELNPTKIFTSEARNDDGRFSFDGLRSPEFIKHEVEVDRKGKALLSPNQSNSCAESICTDGGRFVASGDTDWTLCYKNHLFEV